MLGTPRAKPALSSAASSPSPSVSRPSASITASLWPGTGRPMAPGRGSKSAAQEEATMLHSVWP